MSQYTPVPFKEAEENLKKRLDSLSMIENRLVSKQEDYDLKDLIDAFDFDFLFYQDLTDDTQWLTDFKRVQPISNSTGNYHVCAIPLVKTYIVTYLVACIGISDNPVDFDSLDQEPCRIFIMTLSPVNKTGPHLQFLAEVSLLFKSAEKRQQILETQDKAEVIKILTE